MTPSWSLAPMLGLVVALPAVGCDPDPKKGPDAAASAVKAWAPEGVRGGVKLTEVRCGPSPKDGSISCDGEVLGGGTIEVTAKHTGSDWDIDLISPVIAAKLMEDQIREHLAGMGVEVAPACGDRIRPAKAGDTFKCLVRDADGKEVSAVEVTVKNAEKGTVDWKLLTSLVDVAQVEKQVQGWLGDNAVTGAVRCGTPRKRFSLPETTFTCDVEGVDRGVKVVMKDYRGNVGWDWAGQN